ncbi:MAG: hypothetical protein D6733_07330 [Methanobacteriota archaeon]|nr:MAG: hypothetical protein D6733_07330 [Euryarchaeota archaeon]
MIELQKNMARILAVDVGAGTQDILYFNPAKEPENNLKLVLPSETQLLARRISMSRGDVLLTGETMGGGPVVMAIMEALKKGRRVVMTERSARTVRDDLAEVREEGIEVVTEEEAEGLGLPRFETRDLDLDFLFTVAEKAGEGEPDFIGVAVQDHGFESGKSDRAFRFERIREVIERGSTLEDFLFERPPEYYTRMNAVVRQVKRRFGGGVAVIDSKFAAIAGALHGVDERPCLCVDVGNGHTMVALVDDEIEGVLEHHTHALSKEKLIRYIKRFADGRVSNEEVFNDNGHGCYIKNAPGLKNIKRIFATGPNRRILADTELRAEPANPFGDVMMTGPVGIVDLALKKFY